MTLTIIDVKESDFGNYSCQARNSLGTTMGTIELLSMPLLCKTKNHFSKQSFFVAQGLFVFLASPAFLRALSSGLCAPIPLLGSSILKGVTQWRSTTTNFPSHRLPWILQVQSIVNSIHRVLKDFSGFFYLLANL